jgi:colanic acid/amylovoran biosynthesis protein
MPVEDDHLVSMQLKSEFQDVVVAPRFDSPSAAKSYIAGMDYFCGSRMHACIAAFSSGCR